MELLPFTDVFFKSIIALFRFFQKGEIRMIIHLL